MGEYPTKQELRTIRDWPLTDPAGIVEYVESIWNHDYGLFRLKNLKLELHTGGWSGNEEIIDAIQRHPTFWMYFWQKTERGGHYYFDLR